MAVDKKYIVIGKLVKPFGVKGEIVFLSYSGETAHFKHIELLYLNRSQTVKKLEYWDGLSRGSVQKRNYKGQKIRCKLLGIDSPETAKLICGQDISILREHATPLNHQEWYIADMISLQVVCEGKKVGVVEAVTQDTFQPLLRIRWNNKTEGLIPFNKYFFSNPNLDIRSIELLNASLLGIT